jgi:hypothetical protein
MSGQFLRPIVLTAALVVAGRSIALAADNQIRPFIGATFHRDTTFVTPGILADRAHLVFGGSLVSLRDIFGVEVDVADAPGFFENDVKTLVLSGRVTTFTGNVVVAAPRRLTEYGFRPFLVAGGGVMRLHQSTFGDAFNVTRILPAFDVGGGVLAFFTNRVGFTWEVRRFQNIRRQADPTGLTFDPVEKLSFWRAGFALVYRY